MLLLNTWNSSLEYIQHIRFFSNDTQYSIFNAFQVHNIKSYFILETTEKTVRQQLNLYKVMKSAVMVPKWKGRVVLLPSWLSRIQSLKFLYSIIIEPLLLHHLFLFPHSVITNFEKSKNLGLFRLLHENCTLIHWRIKTISHNVIKILNFLKLAFS
jgi:hypothetical protein